MDTFIETLATTRVERFYPSALAKHLGISSVEAFNYLLERSGNGDQLQLKWELRCPHCYRTLDITIEKQVLDEYDCKCGEEFEPRPSDFFPVFQINPDYKAFIKTAIKKKPSKPEDPPINLIGQPQSLQDILIDGLLSEKAIDKLTSQSPCFLIQIINQNQYNGGDGHMDQRKITGSFNNSKLSGNNAIQADNVVQSQNITKEESEKAFKELFDEIKKISEQSQREQAEYNAEQLKEAVENKDKSKAQKLLGFLKTSIGTVASLTTITRFFGLTL